jgi:8-amino-3,8-dideoxy-alpha-D-manno-octulosonate transaminase
MNKNMTAGEGGCVATSDERLWKRAVACHDLGYARDANGRLVLDDPDLRLWGLGCRLDEVRAAILRVQLRKLPAVTAAMRRSKYRIRRAIGEFKGVSLRRIQDPEGDTGCFLITTYADAAAARAVHEGLLAEGIRTFPQGLSNVVMTDWGLHLYYNIASLVHRTSRSRAGEPWSLERNAASRYSYARGACPAADSLFERSIIIPVPSCLTERDEDEIIEAFRRVLGG